MSLSYREIYDNTLQAVETDLDRLVPHGAADPDELGQLCSSLVQFYYGLGLLEFVLKADVGALYDRFYQAARTFEFLLQREAEGAAIDPSYTSASEIRAILCALAIGELSLASGISVRQRRDKGLYDTEDFHAQSAVLRRLIEAGVDDDARAQRSHFDEARAGRRAPAAAVLEAIATRDSDAFAEAIVSFVEEWREIVEEDDYQDLPGDIFEGEEAVCVQALGFVRLAESRGMTCPPNIPLVPDELRDYRDFSPPSEGYPTA